MKTARSDDVVQFRTSYWRACRLFTIGLIVRNETKKKLYRLEVR